jgi:hypothetical protein
MEKKTDPLEQVREALQCIANPKNYGPDGSWIGDSYPDEIAVTALEHVNLFEQTREVQLKAFLEGLECQNIDELMSQDVEVFHTLGVEMAERIKSFVVEKTLKDGEVAVLKERVERLFPPDQVDIVPYLRGDNKSPVLSDFQPKR